MRKNTQRLHAADGRFLRYVSDQEHNEKIASGECMPYYDQRDRYLGIKFVQMVHEECRYGTLTNVDSPTGLTLADMQRNAMGCIDTPKRRQVYRMREQAQERGEEGKTVPAAIRCYGHDKRNKPNPDLLGNAVDRSMSRVEQWPHASESNRSVTCTPAGVVKLTEMAPEELAQMRSLAL